MLTDGIYKYCKRTDQGLKCEAVLKIEDGVLSIIEDPKKILKNMFDVGPVNRKTRDIIRSVNSNGYAVFIKEDLSKTEDLNKVQIKPAVMAKPERVRLDAPGPNQGKIADVLGQQNDHRIVQNITGQSPFKGTSGPVDEILHAGPVTTIRPEIPESPAVHVFDRNDTHPFLNHTEEQKDLIHGIDLQNLTTPSKPGITEISGFGKNSKGKEAIVKGRVSKNKGEGPTYEELTTAQREGLYHGMMPLFGMQKYVPLTSVVQDNVDKHSMGPGGNHYSVMERVPDAVHFNMFNANHRKTLKDLKENGDLDKLAIMNMVLGNSDRHGGNYMISPKGLHLIDHGFTFSFHNGRKPFIPHYFDYGNVNENNDYDEDRPIHPAALRWLNNIDENSIENFLQSHKIDKKFSEPILGSLKAAKEAAKSGKNIVRTLENIGNFHENYYENYKKGE
jgi:hypothetical protein